VAGGLSFVAVSAGYSHMCGLTAVGAAYCWGHNGYGVLGVGDTTNRRTPAPVTGGVSFAAVSAGFYHTCGLTALGVAYC
jgi:alpha-tubulin suppressor-like RCC1 family protein